MQPTGKTRNRNKQKGKTKSVAEGDRQLAENNEKIFQLGVNSKRHLKKTSHKQNTPCLSKSTKTKQEPIAKGKPATANESKPRTYDAQAA